jgi:hypothetical protein
LAATFEAEAFEPVAFAAVLAVLSGIALLLFFEDFVAGPLRASFTEAFAGDLARPLSALRLTAAAFFDVLEALFLRVFCDTACARKLPRPCSMFHGNRGGPQDTHGRVRLEYMQYSTFSVKINDLRPIPDFSAAFRSSVRH